MARPALISVATRARSNSSDISRFSEQRTLSLRTFRIELDRPNATYVPGELVTGNVIVGLSKEKLVRGLKLSLTGEANVNWERRRTSKNLRGVREDRVDHYRANEQYFDLVYYLLGETEDVVRIPVGFHKYPFSFPLPHNIPCSFEHADGYIRYTAKADMARPWRYDHECKLTFTVIAPYDLNSHSQQCLGIDDEVTESFYCFCFNMGLIRMRCRIPKTGYIPGQWIETTVNLDNTSSVDMTKICFKLQKISIFQAKTPYHTMKVDEITVKSEMRLGPFIPNTDVVSRLQVPAMATPSDLECCNIIDLKYCMRITIHVSGMHCNIIKTYPIVIGTIPLRPTITLQAALQPTAPVIYYDPPPPMPSSPQYSPSHVPYLQTLGFSSPTISINPWDVSPPSYEECTQGTNSIKSNNESNYAQSANEPFPPRYPSFNFQAPHSPGE